MFEHPFLNQYDEDGNLRANKKKEKLEDSYFELKKVIYTHPFEIDKNMTRKGSRFMKVSDKVLKYDIGGVNWLEFGLAFILVLMFSFYCYHFIRDYNLTIDVPREIVETGKSTYSEEIQKEYGSESDINYFKWHTLNECRKSAILNGGILALFILVPILLGFLYWVHFTLRECLDTLTFNREEGTVYYRYNYGFSRRKCTFDEAFFQEHLGSFISRDSEYLALRMPGLKNVIRISYFPYILLSLFTWYMDKNRPLPPGTAFDAYREEDFLRRRQSKFPRPIYPSGVPTPEDEALVKKYRDTDANKRATLYYEPRFKVVAHREDKLREDKWQTK